MVQIFYQLLKLIAERTPPNPAPIRKAERYIQKTESNKENVIK